jgi:hypothetical protein
MNTSQSKALDVLFKKWHGRLKRRGIYAGMGQSVADDFVQEVFLRLSVYLDSRPDLMPTDALVVGGFKLRIRQFYKDSARRKLYLEMPADRSPDSKGDGCATSCSNNDHVFWQYYWRCVLDDPEGSLHLGKEDHLTFMNRLLENVGLPTTVEWERTKENTRVKRMTRLRDRHVRDVLPRPEWRHSTVRRPERDRPVMVSRGVLELSHE